MGEELPHQGETQPGLLTGCCSAPPCPHGVICGLTLSPSRGRVPGSSLSPSSGRLSKAQPSPHQLLSSPRRPHPARGSRSLLCCASGCSSGAVCCLFCRVEKQKPGREGSQHRCLGRAGRHKGEEMWEGRAPGTPFSTHQFILSQLWSCPPAAGPHLQLAGTWGRVGARWHQGDHPCPSLSADFNYTNGRGLTRASRQRRVAAA